MTYSNENTGTTCEIVASQYKTNGWSVWATCKPGVRNVMDPAIVDGPKGKVTTEAEYQSLLTEAEAWCEQAIQCYTASEIAAI